jgi:hypothetical protein
MSALEFYNSEVKPKVTPSTRSIELRVCYSAGGNAALAQIVANEAGDIAPGVKVIGYKGAMDDSPLADNAKKMEEYVQQKDEKSREKTLDNSERDFEKTIRRYPDIVQYYPISEETAGTSQQAEQVDNLMLNVTHFSDTQARRLRNALTVLVQDPGNASLLSNINSLARTGRLMFNTRGANNLEVTQQADRSIISINFQSNDSYQNASALKSALRKLDPNFSDNEWGYPSDPHVRDELSSKPEGLGAHLNINDYSSQYGILADQYGLINPGSFHLVNAFDAMQGDADGRRIADEFVSLLRNNANSVIFDYGAESLGRPMGVEFSPAPDGKEIAHIYVNFSASEDFNEEVKILKQVLQEVDRHFGYAA